MEKEGGNIFHKINTNYAHMQNFIQIPQKMKTEVQNVFNWEKCTLPFVRYLMNVGNPLMRTEICEFLRCCF